MSDALTTRWARYRVGEVKVHLPSKTVDVSIVSWFGVTAPPLSADSKWRSWPLKVIASMTTEFWLSEGAEVVADPYPFDAQMSRVTNFSGQ
jgi:hypothetical protein